MTLADLIQRHEAANVTPLRRSAAGTLTAKGNAAVAGYRFIRSLRELAPEDRAETLTLFAPELRGVIADLADAPA